MAVPPAADLVLLVARLLFGGILALMGLNHFADLDDMAAYAGQKGAPLPRLSVGLTGLLLVLGGLGIVIGVYPLVAAAALAGFFGLVTPIMHDFWRHTGEAKQRELTHFLKNAALFGAALAFLVLANESWTVSLNLGL